MRTPPFFPLFYILSHFFECFFLSILFACGVKNHQKSSTVDFLIILSLYSPNPCTLSVVAVPSPGHARRPPRFFDSFPAPAFFRTSLPIGSSLRLDRSDWIFSPIGSFRLDLLPDWFLFLLSGDLELGWEREFCLVLRCFGPQVMSRDLAVLGGRDTDGTATRGTVFFFSLVMRYDVFAAYCVLTKCYCVYVLVYSLGG